MIDLFQLRLTACHLATNLILSMQMTLTCCLMVVAELTSRLPEVLLGVGQRCGWCRSVCEDYRCCIWSVLYACLALCSCQWGGVYAQVEPSGNTSLANISQAPSHDSPAWLPQTWDYCRGFLPCAAVFVLESRSGSEGWGVEAVRMHQQDLHIAEVLFCLTCSIWWECLEGSLFTDLHLLTSQTKIDLLFCFLCMWDSVTA